SNISGGRGERFTQPGEQPGGFLTKDARFVKVRIPMGREPQGKGDTQIKKYDPAQPKTPYSNAPLKDTPPDGIQPQQPIPLEYRAILKAGMTSQETRVKKFRRIFTAIEEEVGRVIVGQRAAVRKVLTAFFAGGH